MGSLRPRTRSQTRWRESALLVGTDQRRDQQCRLVRCQSMRPALRPQSASLTLSLILPREMCVFRAALPATNNLSHQPAFGAHIVSGILTTTAPTTTANTVGHCVAKAYGPYRPPWTSTRLRPGY